MVFAQLMCCAGVTCNSCSKGCWLAVVLSVVACFACLARGCATSSGLTAPPFSVLFRKVRLFVSVQTCCVCLLTAKSSCMALQPQSGLINSALSRCTYSHAAVNMSVWMPYAMHLSHSQHVVITHMLGFEKYHDINYSSLSSLLSQLPCFARSRQRRRSGLRLACRQFICHDLYTDDI